MMQNGRPLSKRKTVQFLVLLTILAWATQTLFHQWGYGQEIPASEKFVPDQSRQTTGGTLELRTEATVTGTDVKLKQVCRWSDADAKTFAPIGDLVLMRMGPKAPFRSISLTEIKGILHDAGVNLALIKFAGSTSCTVGRGDVEFDEKTALQQWIDARNGNKPVESASATTNPANIAGSAAPASAAVMAMSKSPANATQPDQALLDAAESNNIDSRTLRGHLVADLCARLNLSADEVQMNFSPQDDKVLNLSEPNFRFALEPKRVKNLGDVSWDVTILTETGSQKVSVNAMARAWQNQLVITKPLAARQMIQEGDVIERRALVDKLSDEPLLKREQTISQQASRELKPGTVMTAKMVEAVPLAKTGQFITVTLAHGNVNVKTVAKAMEGGSMGQTIRVKNEATNDVYQVVLTGPQTGSMNAPTKISGVASVHE